jgi:hypothetical protein
MGVANAQRALDYIRIIAEFISQPEYRDVVQLFGVMNEGALCIHPFHLGKLTVIYSARQLDYRSSGARNSAHCASPPSLHSCFDELTILRTATYKCTT